jgi:hypothetical protein
VEIPDLVEQGQLVIQLGLALQLLQELEIGLDRLVGLVLDLEVAGFFLLLGDVQGRPLPLCGTTG